jgi:hypothetical protein
MHAPSRRTLAAAAPASDSEAAPRALLPLDKARWGESIFVHPPALVEQIAECAGLRVVRREFCFLFSVI